jgi:hypothetical protein
VEHQNNTAEAYTREKEKLENKKKRKGNNLTQVHDSSGKGKIAPVLNYAPDLEGAWGAEV